jgi:hypothetical protein
MTTAEKGTLSLTTLLGALAGIITITSGLLFYTGYLFLLGFYRGFGIQIEMLELSAQEILIESGAILVPTLFFTVLVFIVLSFFYARFFAKRSLSDLLKIRSRAIYLGLLIYLLLFTWTIPFVSERVAKAQIDQQFTAYGFLTKTLPTSTVYSDELLPSLTPDETSEGVYTYENLRFLASTDDYFFFFKKEVGTYIIPSSSILLVTFHR